MPPEVDSLLDRILTTRDRGVTVVVVEHNMELVMNVADRVLVMDYGQHLFEGVPADVQKNAAVVSAYLGRRADVSALLAAEDLELAYGELSVCRGISIEVNEGEIVALIGANGAGKSTTLRAIAGLLTPRSGTIRFRRRGHHAARRRTSARCAGIALVPEGRHVFPFLTARENLELGGFKHRARQRQGPPHDRRHLRHVPAAEASAAARTPARSPAASSRCWCSAAP